ncbi:MULTISPECIES: hypothetical protein [unclassified Streptomyces]|uniref:hypothetical protein n=1 Tax=unclassified Streptomyces TaxID=2593676 RepID=UPI0006AFC468|nr:MULTISPECIES: hypothetical protein [unclassified Streptomyces]KOX25086.1 hypothetical protein ADL06_19345 [Streptomyces sp. NRRL F-6491]KOX37047.1 hypothetical protein ADL08_30635 [Streptomyces sp. NRRL F-6492]
MQHLLGRAEWDADQVRQTVVIPLRLLAKPHTRRQITRASVAKTPYPALVALPVHDPEWGPAGRDGEGEAA